MGQQVSSNVAAEKLVEQRKASKESRETPFSSRTDSSNSIAASSSDESFHESYLVDGLLGHGSSANVYKVHSKSSGRSFAAKEITLDGKMNTVDSMRTELEILRSLHAPHLVNMEESFASSEKLWLILEEVQGGDLVQTCANMQSYSEKEVARMFKQILLGVKYLHENGVIHRDLKMENILVEGQGSDLTVKIADFGLAAKLTKKQGKRSKQLKDMWGTVEYFAPEVYQKAYGSQADVWSLGCVLYEMLTGQLAFPHREVKVALFDRIMFHGLKKPMRSFELRPEWKQLSNEARSLIKKMLKVNPLNRFDIDECLNHPWIAQFETNDNDKLELAQKKFAERLTRRALRNKKHLEKLLSTPRRV